MGSSIGIQKNGCDVYVSYDVSQSSNNYTELEKLGSELKREGLRVFASDNTPQYKDEEIEEYDNEEILVDGKFYQGNENILRKDATFKWTEEMLAEVKLCAKSVLHFAEKHFYIVTEDGKKRIELYKYQKRLLKAFTLVFLL
jgi:hypothetical protein